MNGVQEDNHSPDSPSRCDTTPGPDGSCSSPQRGQVSIDTVPLCDNQTRPHIGYLSALHYQRQMRMAA